MIRITPMLAVFRPRDRHDIWYKYEGGIVVTYHSIPSYFTFFSHFSFLPLSSPLSSIFSRRSRAVHAMETNALDVEHNSDQTW